MAPHDDELAFLRSIEQDIQRIQKYSTQWNARDQFNELRLKLNGRIIKLLEDNLHSYETPPRPCNEMGGGSAGLDTAGDFAMHCDKPDKHDGPHSWEDTYNADGSRKDANANTI